MESIPPVSCRAADLTFKDHYAFFEKLIFDRIDNNSNKGKEVLFKKDNVEIKRLKQLEVENAKLKELVA